MSDQIIRDADDYNAMGEIKYYREDYHGAINDFNKAIELESDDSEIFFSRGLAKLMIGQKLEAFRDFIRVMELGDRVSYTILEFCR